MTSKGTERGLIECPSPNCDCLTDPSQTHCRDCQTPLVAGADVGEPEIQSECSAAKN